MSSQIIIPFDVGQTAAVNLNEAHSATSTEYGHIQRRGIEICMIHSFLIRKMVLIKK